MPYSSNWKPHSHSASQTAMPTGTFHHWNPLPLSSFTGIAAQPISAEEMTSLAGEYVYGSGPDDRIIIALGANGLTFLRKGRNTLRLTHLGDRLFHPPGATRVQIRFRSTAAGTILTVHDPDVVLEATKAI